MPRQLSLMTLPDPAWLDVLRAEAAKPGRPKAAIAAELGVSRTAVSLLCAGKYSAKTDKVAAKIAPKIMQLYANRVWCPHLREAIAGTACAGFHSAPMSMSDPAKLRHWRACRACPQNPSNQQKAEVKHAV